VATVERALHRLLLVRQSHMQAAAAVRVTLARLVQAVLAAVARVELLVPVLLVPLTPEAVEVALTIIKPPALAAAV
jgi:hypothetical protein